MNPPKALQFQNVHKKFKDFAALEDITFDVEKGSFLALLGANGAGKTTLISCLSGLTKRDSGSILVDGLDPEKHPVETKMKLGIVEQELSFDPFFTPMEILKLRRGLFGLPQDNEYLEWLLKKLNLLDKKNAKVRSLSGGMKRRLMIAKAMAHDPEILILDEPTAGVDVELRQNLYAFLRELQSQKGKTIVLTTHYIEEAELLAKTIVIQDTGKTILVENKEKLIKQYDNAKLETIFLKLTSKQDD